MSHALSTLILGGDVMGRARRRVVAAQNISRMCLVCGVDNVAGLHARFYELAPEEGEVGADATGASVGPELLGVFAPQPEHQSYPGRLHGGIASAILDETIGRAITMLHPGTWGVTAELRVRFRRPVPLDAPIRAVGRITRDTRRLFEGAGEILLADGSVAVEAAGKYLKMDLEEIAPGGMSEAEWFADRRHRPDDVDIASTEPM
jgi:acyl-coenzyme A thioesterase PaaI-like protein